MSIMIKQTPLSEQEMVAEAEKALADISRIRQGVGKVIFGQESVVERTLVALLAGGHALLVGVPGLAKTKLVETLGIVLGLDFPPHPVHAGPDAVRHPRLRGDGAGRASASAPSASSPARSSRSC